MALSRAEWHKSSRSGSSGDCIEARATSDVAQIRDSKDPSGPALTFAHTAWADFVTDVKSERFTR